MNESFPSSPPRWQFEVGAQPDQYDLMDLEDLRTTGEQEEANFRMNYADQLEEIEQANRVVPSREEAEDLNDVPASPIRVNWPSDSLLKPDHFTIDQQRCLHCSKELGYAMPMNRIPKVGYLFCKDFECQHTQQIHCWACGHFTSETNGHLVSRPGNSAYTGPSSIFSYMCKTCFEDQCKMEPNLEETREMFQKYRTLRHESEEKEKAIAELALQDSSFNPTSKYNCSFQKVVGESSYSPSSSAEGEPPRKRKREKSEEEEKF